MKLHDTGPATVFPPGTWFHVARLMRIAVPGAAHRLAGSEAIGLRGRTRQQLARIAVPADTNRALRVAQAR